MSMTRQCVWTQEDWNGDCWDSACGGLFRLDDGSPSDNKMKYCPYCGGDLVEKAWEHESEDSDDE